MPRPRSRKYEKREVTPFERAVYAITAKIPKGKVATYAWVGRQIGQPRAVRAIGTALNKNPFAPEIPCHRVICSDGQVGGFARGEEQKIRMLRREGIVIKDGQVEKSFILE